MKVRVFVLIHQRACQGYTSGPDEGKGDLRYVLITGGTKPPLRGRGENSV